MRCPKCNSPMLSVAASLDVEVWSCPFCLATARQDKAGGTAKVLLGKDPTTAQTVPK